MKTLFDEQIQANIKNQEKESKRKIGLKISKSDDPSIDKFGIELYDEKKMDFFYKRIYSREEYEKIRTKQGLGGFDKLDSLIIDFIKDMEHCDNDWLQITENTDATCNFDLMSRKRKGYKTGSQLQLILSKIVGEDLVKHLVSKAESLQEKFEEAQERINSLSDKLNSSVRENNEKDKLIEQQTEEKNVEHESENLG
uniref:Uncharacterized protein n=1 Tax=Panagrolaimus sp. JU765 TaxID=591449 RepID=A0AC34R0Y9_9BILA